MRNFTVTAFRGKLLLLLLISAALQLEAQTDISIGTGTAGNGGTSYPTPLQDWYEGSRAQYLYQASELNAAGITAGMIHAIKFDVTALNNFDGDIQQLSIKIGTTSTASLATAATDWETVNNTVFGPVDYTPQLGMNAFVFSTPFYWNGTDNIVIEICNGLPANTGDGLIHYTQNTTVPWTTGLSFNGSHTIAIDNNGNLCSGTTTAAITNTPTNRPNITFSWTVAAVCTGTPVGGTAVSNFTTVCNSTLPFTLNVTGATSATGLTYQWQDSTQASGAWNNITGATNYTYTAPGITANTWFRRRITCGANSSFSAKVGVSLTPPVYTTLPFTESFENWINACNSKDIPGNSWRNTPATGNSSWRRNDDGSSANWSSGNGSYTPESSTGTYSARFHSYNASSGVNGRLELYLNCANPSVTKKLSFDYINTTGNDSLIIYVSTNGGTSFTRLDSARATDVWRTKTLYFNSTSATTIIRFEATANNSLGSDIGLDNVGVTNVPNCTGTPVGGTALSSLTNVCNPTIPFTLSVTGATFAGALTYQWQDSTQASGAWTNIPNATGETYTPTGIAANTWYRRVTICSGNNGYSASVQVSLVAPAYATLPFTESFENTWINGCDTRDIPNNYWRNSPATGNPSWRRYDDWAAANWTSNSGAYTPQSSAGTYSARFHSFHASSGTKGRLDLYVNCNTPAPNKALSFDYINTSGSDSLVILVSTNGGTTFTRVDSVRTIGAWKTKTVFFNSSSPTTIVRFEATSDFGATDIGLDNISLADFPSCSGTPVGGTTLSTLASVCNSTTPFTVSVNGATFAAGLTYQWQRSADGSAWSDITANGTSATYAATGITANTWFRRQIICGANSSYSDAVQVSFVAPAYALMPYAESFESWTSVCDNKDVPNNFWRNTPMTGNSSWRRDDEGVSAGWTTITGGAYTPAASVGTYSARFHSNTAPNTPRAQLDLYLNASTGGALKRLTFDYINTSGNDSLIVYVSTNGGTSFTRLDSVRIATEWRTKAIYFTSTSATTVLRFEAADASSTTDIGLDNVLVIDWSDCSGKPNGGTAVSSTTSACRDPFTVSVTGVSTGNGIQYQWQRSTDNSNWSNTSPADTSLSMITSQIGTTWYRVITTCSFSGQSDTSVAVQVISPTPVSGLLYTIDNSQPTGGLNFHTFNDAYNFIKCGINGPVLFTVKTGIGEYNEQLIMTPIPGASAVNTVTFKGNGVASIGYAATNSNERAVIKLRCTRHIVIDSLVINANTGTYGYGVQLMANTDSNVVQNCIINSSVSSAEEGFAGIVINGSDAGPVSTGTVLSDDNLFARNTITGGYYGITLVATYNGGGNGGNRFIDNIVKEFYRYGIYVAGSYKTLIDGNTFSRPGRADVGAFTGIFFTTQDNTACKVSGNRIHNPFGGAPASTADFHGINFTNSDADVADVDTVCNNLIYHVNGKGLVYGIANTGSNHVYYLHNTIVLDSAGATATDVTRGFYNTGTTTGLAFYNNIIAINRDGAGEKHAIYLNSNLPFADNNDYYLGGAGSNNYLGYYGSTSYTNIIDWRTAVSASPARDITSLVALPAFVNPATGNYTPGNAGIDDKGFAIGIPDDILGQPRSATTPDIGAYEFTPPPCSVPPVNGYTIVTPDTVCQYNPVFLNLNIGAFGSAQTFQWQAAKSAAGPFTAIGGPKLSPDTVITADTTLYLRVAISCGSATIYSDTVLLVVNPALPAGTYTINNTAATDYIPGQPGGNFHSFADAKAAMGCGIGGAIVFNVKANTGPYLEQLRLDSIPGVSIINTITFNGNGNTIAFNATDANEKAVIKLSGADHIIFDSLVIDASSGTYGYGVQLVNNADSNTFRRCTILSSTTATTTDFAGVVINATHGGVTATGNTFCDNNLFEHNTITGGYYGVTLVGSTTTANFINGNRFVNNTISEFYNYGLYAAGTVNTLIERNTFTRPTRTTSATNVYGIYLTSAPSLKLHIAKNRFTRFFGGAPGATAGFYGIAHNSVDATSGNEDTVSNNLFYNLDGKGVIYTLHNTGSNNVHYYHNAIAIDNDTSTTTAASAGFYQTTSASGIRFFNNIVTVTRGGTGNKHAVYLNTSGSGVIADHNVYYVAGSNAHIGYFTANRTTLADWITATSEDTSSFALNPLYTEPAAGNLQPQLAAIDNKGEPQGIGTDVLDALRHATTPDIGAYEFAPQPCANPPVAGAASVTPASGICLEAPIQLNVTGHSPLGSITFQWFSSADNGATWDSISPVQYFPEFNTVTTTSTLYRAAVTCNGVTTYTTTTQVTLNTVLLEGLYTIGGPAGPKNFPNFQSAVSALLCGITGPVVFNVAPGIYNEQIRIPYIPNTSARNTVTFQGASGVASDANLTYAGTATANYTLKLDSTRYFIFRNLTITGTDATNGRVVELANTASYDSIVHCTIVAPVATTSSTNVVGIYANNIKGRNHVIQGNTIRNGVSGIYLTGTNTGANLTPYHVIDSNTISGAFQYGIHAGNVKQLQLTRNNINLLDTAHTTAYGVWAIDCDSSFDISGNKITISNISTTVYGMSVRNSDSALTARNRVAGNTIRAVNNNRGNLYGLHLLASPGTEVVNNVIAIKTSGANSYGLYHDNFNVVNYYNNSVNSEATSATNNFAAYFVTSATSSFQVRNNIFSHKGGGKALFVTNTDASYLSDYNMLYTTGTVLAQRGNPAGTFATLADWKNASYWDVNSIGYAPAFVSGDDLQPALSNPDVWAMHGRGAQITGNNYDFNNAPRPTTLTTGVPDLGAYEFYPIALPTVLAATPAVPVANQPQTFMYGTDTVMKITWGATVPTAAVEARRYSGVVPAGLVAGTDSMYFYTKVDIAGGGSYDYDMKLFYLDPWQGSIPDQHMIGLGKTTASNSWVVGFSSRTDVLKKTITQAGVNFIDKFTGLVNPYAPPVLPDKDSSNRGRRFWVAYPINQLDAGSTQQMVLYLSAQEAANVQVRINGTTWVRNYFVPANSVTATEYLPKAGVTSAYLSDPGLSDRGISIVSDVPIVAYAHVIGSTSSGASMLLPVGVWGYEYKTLGITQSWGSGGYSYYYVVADNDSTRVEITSVSGVALQNPGMPAGTPYYVNLMKGQVYQVIASSTTAELSGSLIRSVPNEHGKCFPIATFSGSSRTYIDCPTSGAGGGDFIMQQNFPSTAWGKRYLTAPSSNSSTASVLTPNIYRVAVKDPSTVVKKNGVVMTGLVNNFYYEYISATADYIESDKPIMVAQYLTGACEGVGDPEMIYLSPIEQGIDKIAFYRNTEESITTNYLTLIVPTNGLSSLTMIAGATPTTPDFTYPHPQNGLLNVNYTVVVKRWTSAKQQVRVQCDSAFTAITYGLGSVESYGYNAGTLVKTLHALGDIKNTLDSTNNRNDFTCDGTPFRFTAYLPFKPASLAWKFSRVAGLSPNADSAFTNPVPQDSIVKNGMLYYVYPVQQDYTFAGPGVYGVEIVYEHPDIESCDHTGRDMIYVQVVPQPKPTFTTNFSTCVNDVAQFTGKNLTDNGIVIDEWKWTFHDQTTATGQQASYSYNAADTFLVKLDATTPDGCIGHNQDTVIVNPRPVVSLLSDSLNVCPNGDTIFVVQNPVAGDTYTWYTAASGGSPVHTGDTLAVDNVTATAAYYVEGISDAGCASPDRKRVVVTAAALLTPPAVTLGNSGATSITFNWAPVAGAVAYAVSIDNGPFIAPSSGPAGTSHTVTGLSLLQPVSIVVEAIGALDCQNNRSAPLNACTNADVQVVTDSIAICTGLNATFNIASPVAGTTYTWYDALTGGTEVATGPSFEVTNVTTTTAYYVQQTSVGGCSSGRTRVVVVATAVPAQPIVVADSVGTDLVRFAWSAVEGADSYQVSLDNGNNWITPSSGATGLTHTVGGLQPMQTVTILVKAIGCKEAISQPLSQQVMPDGIFIPNAFTPNNDGRNDVLQVYSYKIREMTFMVFNQWGEKIFESRNQSVAWDGKYKGKVQPSGVYMYVCKMILTDGTVINRKGSINLIR